MSQRNPDDIEKEIRTMIADMAEMDEEEITGELRLVEDLGFDSMKALELLARLEKQYKIRIAEEELPNLTSQNQIVELVKRYLS